MYSEAQKHLSRVDKVLAAIIEEHGACSLRPQRSYFYVLCDAIISQQVSVQAAAAISNRLKGLFSGRTPKPSELLSLSEEQLKSIGVSRAKASYLRNLAEHFHTGRIRPRKLTRMADEEVMQTLLEVKGIGPWTAQMFLIFSLNRLDVLPTGDLGLQRAMMIQYRLQQMPTKALMEQMAECWRPYRSVATWYLWRSIDNLQAKPQSF